MDAELFSMSPLGWFLGIDLKYQLGIAVFTFTVGAYAVLFILGRRWRREFEARGVTYWSASKEERMEELISEVWEPRKITVLYGLSYFSNGFVRTAFNLWVPVFLLDEVGLGTIEASAFMGLLFVSWSWKMFVGLVADVFPIRWRGRLYKRKPWFVVTGVLYLVGIAIMAVSDIETAPVWSVLFPACVSIITAGAFYDMAADSFAIDVTPPEYHARVIGGVSTAGQSVGAALATVLPLWLLDVGGYKLVFLLAGVTGLTSFLFLTVKEPEAAEERAFSREAVAFTFTERTVVIAVLIMFFRSFTMTRISSPLNTMFTIAIREAIHADVALVSTLGLAATVAGLAGSLIGGSFADKYGHKKAFMIATAVFAGAGLLWVTLSPGTATVWIVVVVMISSFMERFWTGTVFAIMADATPLAMSSTVYQMYMSWSWIGNIPASILIGYLLGISLSTTVLALSSVSVVVLLLGLYVKPYEAGKASKV
ncbi:MAG TPA: MFS transporter [Candidatus Krumholzibacteriaceae bacterium]|nr:MFS transporter [Candidatus Krumholzibacteriaceae bacterium]